MTPPQTVTEWIQQMRAAEAAMTPGEWIKCIDSHAPNNGKTVAWIEAGEDALIYVADIPNENARRVADAAGIVAARNSLRRMVDVVAAAHAMSSNFVHATTCGISTDGGPCDCPLRDLRKALAALPVRP